MKLLCLSKSTVLAIAIFLICFFGFATTGFGLPAVTNGSVGQDWVAASGSGWGPLIDPDVYQLNRLEDKLTNQDTEHKQQNVSPSFATIAEMKVYVSEKIYARESPINVVFTGDTTNLQEQLDTMLEEIIKTDDYLYFSVKSWRYGYEGSPGNLPVVFNLDYRTTRAQEDFVESEVIRILGNIVTPNMNKHQKVKAIHDYIVANTAYDTTYTRYTAYNILAEGKAVCQGYAMLAYLMLKEADITVMIISGEAGGEAHGWNLVQLDGNWYHLDCTWNDPIPDVPGRVLYDFYLITDNEIAKTHAWDRSKWPAANTVYVDPGDQLFSLILSANPSGGGSVSGAGSYSLGANVTVTAAPSAGFNFVNWTENNVVVSTSNTYSFTITGNKTLVANFETTTTNWAPWREEMPNQPVDKQWNILFSQDIDAGSIDQSTVWVEDSRGIKIMQERNTTARTVIISPPEGGYQPGESYTLYISDNIISKQGLRLTRAIKMVFSVAD